MAVFINDFSNQTLQVYAYEGFDYEITSPYGVSTASKIVSNSSAFGPSPSPVYFPDIFPTIFTFKVSDLSNNLIPGTIGTFTLTATSNSLIPPFTTFTSNATFTVNIGPGRFLDASGVTLSNTSYVFYRNEPILQTLGKPLRLVAPSFTLKPPTSIPALPPGLSFSNVASNIYDIVGTPLTTVPNSNYQIIGASTTGSKVVTTRINIAVSNDRLRLNVSGSPIIGNMEIGNPIVPRVITAVPIAGTNVIRYAFPTLPDGIVAQDISGNTQSSPFSPIDPSFTMIITGTPTSNAAYFFRDVGATSNGLVYTVQARREVPAPFVDTNQDFVFRFAETVLFDLSSVGPFYVGNAVDSSANFFRARTYFTSNVDMSDIFSPDLGLDLSLIFVPSLSRANVSGTPLSAGSGNFTIRATNSNNVSRDYVTTITALNDSVSFTSPVGVDLCYSFILSRPLSLQKTGYYPSNIQFAATAASQRPVSFSAPALTGTGLSIDASGFLTGIPTTVTPLTDLIVTANVSGSPATATKTVKFSILDDVFTFGDVCSNSFNFIQNLAITPFQIPVTTLSERNVVDFSQFGLPDGLTISPAGIVSGTPTSAGPPLAGNATIFATTGFASGSRDYSYNITPDSMVLFVSPTTYSYKAGDPVGSIQIQGASYSGGTPSNFDLSMSPTYGLTLSSLGLLSGTWTTGVPPDILIPELCNFTIRANVGTLSETLSAQFTANPVLSNAMLLATYTPNGSGGYLSQLFSTSSSTITKFSPPETIQKVADGEIIDIQYKNNNPDSNTFLATFNEPGGVGGFFRGTLLASGAQKIILDSVGIFYTGVSSIANKTGTNTWWAVGTQYIPDESRFRAVVQKSTDDGITWNINNAVILTDGIDQILSRNFNRTGGAVPSAYPYAPYLSNGLALRYSADHGVLMAGGVGDTGGSMLRSTDDGSTWSAVPTGFVNETAYFSFDNSSIWVATGSDQYRSFNSITSPGFTSPTSTIKYSTNQGQTWSNVSSGDFNMFGYEVVYGNNTWLATGVSVNTVGPSDYITPELRYSTDGSNWTKIDLSTNPLFNPSNTLSIIAPLRIGSMNFDGNYWNVYVNEAADGLGGYTASVPRVYRHDISSSLTSGWFAENVVFAAQSNTRFLALTPPRYMYTGTPPININLTFNVTTANGPTFNAPVNRAFLLYQYIPITPIQIQTTIPQDYIFVATTDLPPGLSFNPLTGQITGTPVRIGNDTVTVLARNPSGITAITLNFTVIIPRIIRKQDGAGAYTSLLRQYTEVLGAQNARDNRALPSQERALGEFMSPEAPDVITQIVDPKCFDPKCLR